MRTITLFGVRYCAAAQGELLAAITAPLQPGECRTAAFAPVTSLSQAARDESYRQVLNGMSLCAMDGMPVVKRAQKLDPALADIQRCSGPDMLRLVLAATQNTGARHYFYGTTEENLAALRQAAAQRYPGLCIAGTHAPPFRPLSAEEEAEDIRRIRAATKTFPQYGVPRAVGILRTLWTVENELLTSTMKLKRRTICERFSTLIDQMYAEINA